MLYLKKTFTAADLVPGQTYQIISSFKDYDGIIHPVDQRWRQLKKDFLPYEDGLSLTITTGGQIKTFRLPWRKETQGQIIYNFSDYVAEV